MFVALQSLTLSGKTRQVSMRVSRPRSNQFAQQVVEPAPQVAIDARKRLFESSRKMEKSFLHFKASRELSMLHHPLIFYHFTRSRIRPGNRQTQALPSFCLKL